MSFDNALWEQLKHCKPIVLPAMDVDVREIRNEQWTIITNSVSGKNIRLNEHAAALLASIDGETTLEELLQSSGADDVQPEELISWVASLLDVSCKIRKCRRVIPFAADKRIIAQSAR